MIVAMVAGLKRRLLQEKGVWGRNGGLVSRRREFSFMTNRRLVTALRAVFVPLAVSLLLLGNPAAGAETSLRPPNVVLIIADDLHWGDAAFMGHPHLRTPHLDRLARESLRFGRGYVTSSLCCPSLASIITGHYPHEHKIVGNDPPERPDLPRNSPAGQQLFAAGREALNRHLDAWPTLPKLLCGAGYKSLQTGKWWQGDFQRGGFTSGMTRGERHGDEGLVIGRKTMQPIEDFVRGCRTEQTPFLVWYAPMLPHDPHDPAADLVEHYQTLTPSLPVARSWANIERFDATVGQLLRFLDTEGLAADTLVVFVTDNGWIQNPDRPGFAPRSKLSPYDSGVRTAIMLRQPGRIEPAVSRALASSLDILPTVLAACNVEPPAGLPGIDLLDAQGVAERRQIFGECYTHTIVDLDDPAQSLLWRFTVRDDWKLIVPVTAGPAVQERGRGEISLQRPPDRVLTPEGLGRFERGEPELYNLAEDPYELVNLADKHPALVGELHKSLDVWWTP